MENKEQKTIRKYTDSLSEIFMTTKEIAKLWNREFVDENGEKRIHVQRTCQAKMNDPWEADNVSKLFSRTLKNWGLSEYISFYRYQKIYYLKSFEQDLKDMLHFVQIDISRSKGKKEADDYNELKEELQAAITWLENRSGNNRLLEGEYIFNKAAFSSDSESCEYNDPLYYVCNFKEENCTIDVIKNVAEALVRMLPFFKSAALQKTFQLYLKERDKYAKEVDGCCLRAYMDIDAIKFDIEKKLCQHFLDDKDRWRVNGRWKMQKDESKEIYRIKLTIMDYVIKKYIFLLGSIHKVRAIEKEVEDHGEDLSVFSIYSIKAAYEKYFEYKMDDERRDDIKEVESIGDVNAAMDTFIGEFYSKFNNAPYISEDEKGEISIDFMDEMDMLLDEVLIFDKLNKLVGDNSYITKEDLKQYFDFTKKKDRGEKIALIKLEEHGLKIMENEHLQNAINQVGGFNNIM